VLTRRKKASGMPTIILAQHKDCKGPLAERYCKRIAYPAPSPSLASAPVAPRCVMLHSNDLASETILWDDSLHIDRLISTLWYTRYIPRPRTNMGKHAPFDMANEAYTASVLFSLWVIKTLGSGKRTSP
jgi:hypothetical protein